MGTTRKQIDIVLEGKDRASSVLRSVGGRIKSFAKNAAKIGAAAAAAVAVAVVGAIAIGVKQQFAEIDKLAKTSEKLSIPTEALAAMKLQATETGASFGVLEKSIQKMVAGIADAVAGTGLAKDEFIRLGLSVEDLQKLRPDKAFLAIADAMGKTTNKQVKLNAIMKIFGAKSTDLIQIIDQGTKGFDKFAAKVDRFGTAISNVDAKKIEDVNDAISQLQEIAKGGLQALAIVIAPGLKDKIQDLIDFLAPETPRTQQDVLASIDKEIFEQQAKIKKLEAEKGNFFGASGTSFRLAEQDKLNILFVQRRFTVNQIVKAEKIAASFAISGARIAAAEAKKRADALKELERAEQRKKDRPFFTKQTDDLIRKLGAGSGINEGRQGADPRTGSRLPEGFEVQEIVNEVFRASRGAIGGVNLGGRQRGLLEQFQGADPAVIAQKKTADNTDAMAGTLEKMLKLIELGAFSGGLSLELN